MSGKGESRETIMDSDEAYEDAKTSVKLAFKKYRDYIKGLSYSDYQEFKERQKIRMEHECKEFVSLCCGAERHEYVDTICAQCLDHTGFECIDCQTLLEIDG